MILPWDMDIFFSTHFTQNLLPYLSKEILTFSHEMARVAAIDTSFLSIDIPLVDVVFDAVILVDIFIFLSPFLIWAARGRETRQILSLARSL
jgi:hypothetical protein